MVSRRRFLGFGLSAAAAAVAGPGIFLRPAARAAEPGAKPRFLHIFLNGGWDSALCTDPLVGAKVGLIGSTYNAAYSDYDTHAVPGKPLVVGAGLVDALPAFAAMPTAFVNGMYVRGHRPRTGQALPAQRPPHLVAHHRLPGVGRAHGHDDRHLSAPRESGPSRSRSATPPQSSRPCRPPTCRP